MLDFLKKMLPGKSSDSPSGVITKADMAKVLRDAVIVGVVSALTFLGAHVGDLTSGMGELATGASAVLTLVISAAVRWLKDNGPKE